MKINYLFGTILDLPKGAINQLLVKAILFLQCLELTNFYCLVAFLLQPLMIYTFIRQWIMNGKNFWTKAENQHHENIIVLLNLIKNYLFLVVKTKNINVWKIFMLLAMTQWIGKSFFLLIVLHLDHQQPCHLQILVCLKELDFILQ